MRRTPLNRGDKPLRRWLKPSWEATKARPKRKSGVRVLRDGREVCYGTAWDHRRREVWERDGRRCVLCGRPLPELSMAEIDHIQRRGMGGGKRDDRKANLRALCHWCHQARHETERSPKFGQGGTKQQP